MECNRPQECCHPVHDAIAGRNFCEDKVVQNDTAVTSGSMGFEEMADETQERLETEKERALREAWEQAEVRVLQAQADLKQQYQSNQDLAREALAWKEVAERYGKALDLIHREAVK